MTERLSAPEGIVRAAELLRGGGIVAFPTETVYGLGANALDAAAVAKIFAAKERPGWDPVIVHVRDRAMLERVAAIPHALRARVEALTAAFWPGPLTLLLPRRETVPGSVTAGRPLVGVRMPRHAVALDLIAAAGVPVAAPSANRFGRISPTTAVHVFEDLDGRIDAVLDGGATEVGVESTVLDVTQTPMMLYRPGAVSSEEIAAVAGPVVVHRPAVSSEMSREALPSPGVGIRHYAPRTPLRLVASEAEMRAAVAEGGRAGVLLPAGWRVPDAAAIFDWGSLGEPKALAQRLFAGLRALDAAGIDLIVAPLPAGDGMVRALRDRLEKAAIPG